MNRWVPAQPLRWVGVAALLRGQPLGSIVRLPPARVEHPRDAGMVLALAVPVGQRADYRLDVGGGQDLVVSEFAHGFEARIEVRPALADFERALRDAPGSSVVGMIAAGALVGLALGRSKESALAGATIGGLAALAGVGVANAQTAPEITEAATRMLAAIKPLTPGTTPSMQAKPARAVSGRRRGP
ncbi:MAG: hypothetical protein IPK71_29620 [Myxococcales bacterium]|nr:hypothetical protein [Myxococcales bacterium]